MNPSSSKSRMAYGAIAAALVLAASLLLLLTGSRKAPVFAEFAASDALDGSADCCLNALTVLDRYAEEPDRERPSELLLASYRDRDETEGLISLLVEPDEPLYAALSPYFAAGESHIEAAILSGYFFCEPLNRNNKGAEEAFGADADAYIAWRTDESPAYRNPVVLRFAGDTEAAYDAACKKANRGTVITVVVLFALALACGVRLFTIREKKAA